MVRCSLPLSDLSDLPLCAGPISSVSIFGKNIIILNDAKAAFNLLEKKSSLYSNRPTFHMAGEMYVPFSSLTRPHASSN